jgi:hypothetical protein
MPPLPSLALVLFLVSAALSAGVTPPVTVAGLRMTGPDLEVLVSGPLSPDVPVSAVLLDAAGNAVASGAVEMEDGEARAVLTGALAQLATHPPTWRVVLTGDDGSALGDAWPFLVALRCPPGEPCRFRLLSGLAAPGTVLVDPALGRALDSLPAGTVDLLAAAVAADPSLRGAALTAAWHWASLPAAPPGKCGCVWTFEPSLSGVTGEGGVAAGVTARAVSREDGLQVEQSRSAALALRQRCVQAGFQAAETVLVVDAEGSWSTVLQIPRVVLSQCPAPCAPEVLWEAEIAGKSLARVDGGPGASAGASWESAVEVDGSEVLQVEDATSAVSGTAGSEAVRSAEWAGAGELLAVRATARAEMAVPGGPTDAEAMAAIDWHLAGRGESSCALPEQVEVSAASPDRIGCNLEGPRNHYDPGQIGLLLTDGRLCSPGRRK